MVRQRSGLPGLSDDLAARARLWAEQSCAEQGLPVKVTARDVLGQVAVLLGAASAGGCRQAPTGERHERRRTEDSTRLLDPPDRGHTHRVEAVVATTARADDSMVENRSDDRPLPA